MMKNLLILLLFISVGCDFSYNPNKKEMNYIINQIDSVLFDHFPYTDGFIPFAEYSGEKAINKSGIFICIIKKADLIYTSVPIKNDLCSYFIVDKGKVGDKARIIKLLTRNNECKYTKPLPNFMLLNEIGYNFDNRNVFEEGRLVFYECGKEIVLNEKFKATIEVDKKGWEHGYSRGTIITKENDLIYWIDAW